MRRRDTYGSHPTWQKRDDPQGGDIGHEAHLGKEHAALALRLQHGIAAMVEPADPAARAAWQEIMEALFSPEEAALAARLPILPASLARIASRVDMGTDTLQRHLDSMADKGLVIDLPDLRDGETRYMLAPPMIGFFELSMMRLAGDPTTAGNLAQAYDIYLGAPGFLEELSGGDTSVSRVLVNEATLLEDLMSEVLDWERASELVGDAERASVGNCYCRHKALHLGKRCDKFPMDTCISLNAAADHLIRRGFGREIDRGEAMEILVRGREAGLVHIADNVQRQVTYICSCCSCCCEELRSVRVGRAMVIPSGFQPMVKEEICTGCGICQNACPVEAISLVSRPVGVATGSHPSRPLAQVDLDRCIGCGVCVAQCREHSIEMRRRPQQPRVPVNVIEFVVRSMIERGRLADLLIDGTAGRGPAFANAVIRTILSLPPADRLAASEQVRSRFVRFALARA